MPKYTPSFIDYGAVAKAYSDELYRQAQLNIKRNEMLDKHFDTEYKMYSGKVRQQDLAEFDSGFAQYKLAAKGYQKANRSTGHNISDASMSVDMSKNNMLGYVQDSAKLGEYGKNLKTYRKEAKNLLDRDKLDAVLMDTTTLTTSEFKDKYGDYDKWPSPEQFDWKEQDVNIGALQNAILKTNHFGSSKQMIPSLDDNGVQKTITESVNFGTNPSDAFTYSVPLVKLQTGPSPDAILFSVKNAGEANNSWGNLFKKSYSRLTEELKSQNPSVQIEAQKKVEDIRKKFPYIQSFEQITPEHVYASQFINENNLDDVEVKDYRTLNAQMSLFAKNKGMKDKDARLALLKQKVGQKKSGDLLSTMTKVANLVYKARVTGMLGDPNLKKNLQDAFSAVGVTITDDTFKKMTESKMLDINDISDIILNEKQTPPKVVKRIKEKQ